MVEIAWYEASIMSRDVNGAWGLGSAQIWHLFSRFLHRCRCLCATGATEQNMLEMAVNGWNCMVQGLNKVFGCYWSLWEGFWPNLTTFFMAWSQWTLMHFSPPPIRRILEMARNGWNCTGRGLNKVFECYWSMWKGFWTNLRTFFTVWSQSTSIRFFPPPIRFSRKWPKIDEMAC